jgi:hypothetical protein
MKKNQMPIVATRQKQQKHASITTPPNKTTMSI